MKSLHIPVLLKEVLENLNISKCKTIVDCTFGIGGYTESILRHNINVYSMDLDSQISSTFVSKLKNEFGEKFQFKNDNFKNIDKFIQHTTVDGIIYGENSIFNKNVDLGVNSIQLAESERGFSFKKENNGPLDMRLNALSEDYPMASDVLNSLNESDLIKMLKEGGETKNAVRIARGIINHRALKPFQSTLELVDIVQSVYGNEKFKNRNVATKSFQSLRIYVNEEYNNLKVSLSKCESL
jgi:16S rRNA (cytosine1402-N4)-methyltransferase